MLAARALRNNFHTARRLYGLSVVYRRGPLFVELAVAVGRTETENVDTEGVVSVRGRVRDYLIAASELILNGQHVRPEAGDTIEQWVGSVKMIHEVRPIADGQHWRWHDPNEETFRVHTKWIRSEP